MPTPNAFAATVIPTSRTTAQGSFTTNLTESTDRGSLEFRSPLDLVALENLSFDHGDHVVYRYYERKWESRSPDPYAQGVMGSTKQAASGAPTYQAIIGGNLSLHLMPRTSTTNVMVVGPSMRVDTGASCDLTAENSGAIRYGPKSAGPDAYPTPGAYLQGHCKVKSFLSPLGTEIILFNVTSVIAGYAAGSEQTWSALTGINSRLKISSPGVYEHALGFVTLRATKAVTFSPLTPTKATIRSPALAVAGLLGIPGKGTLFSLAGNPMTTSDERVWVEGIFRLGAEHSSQEGAWTQIDGVVSSYPPLAAPAAPKKSGTPAEVVSLVVAAALLAGAGYALRKWLAALFLFTRLTPTRAWDHPTRRLIREALRHEPGLGQCALAKRIGVSRRAAGYHVAVLQGQGLVQQLRLAKRTVYVLSGQAGDRRRLELALATQNKKALELLKLLKERADATQRDLALELGISQPRVSVLLRRLVALGLVSRQGTGKNRRTLS